MGCFAAPAVAKCSFLCSTAVPGAGDQRVSISPPSPQAGMSTLCKALADNKATGSSLRHLDLSGNPGTLSGDDIIVSARAVMGWHHLGSVPCTGLLGSVVVVCPALQHRDREVVAMEPPRLAGNWGMC